jgi:hypothetical protein
LDVRRIRYRDRRVNNAIDGARLNAEHWLRGGNLREAVRDSDETFGGQHIFDASMIAERGGG